MKEEKDQSLVEVFNGSLWEVEVIKGLLSSNNINVVIKDGIMGVISPYSSTEVTLLVNQDDYEAAMEIIREKEKKEE